jgi:hypothetical protein
MLTQAVQAATDHSGPIEAFFRRLRKRKKYDEPMISTARKLVTVAYLMLKNNESCWPRAGRTAECGCTRRPPGGRSAS